MKKTQPIGIFDSGLGGLTVMRELIQTLPNEDFIYFGDTARVPYGSKSSDTIVRYAMENASFLLSKDVKMLVVACNTASAYAIDALRQEFAVCIEGVIKPAVQAISLTKCQRIAVLGTTATILSGVYQRKIQEYLPNAQVIPIACPLFVPLIEENFLEHPATRLIIKEYLKPIKEKEVDTVVLGCTHYPLLSDLIREEIGEKVVILDSATSCAQRVIDQLEVGQLRNKHLQKGEKKYYVSDDPKRFRTLGEDYLGIPIEQVKLQTFNSVF